MFSGSSNMTRIFEILSYVNKKVDLQLATGSGYGIMYISACILDSNAISMAFYVFEIRIKNNGDAGSYVVIIQLPGKQNMHTNLTALMAAIFDYATHTDIGQYLD